MRKSSRQVVFINTSPPEDRVQLLKPLQEIKNMEDDSDEVYASCLIKRYIKRPDKREKISLSDWASWYDSTGKPYVKPSREMDVDNYPLRQIWMIMMTILRKAKVYKRIRKRQNYQKLSLSELSKLYRELIMLFTCWRNEKTDRINNCSSYQARCLQVKTSIDEQMKQYAICGEHLHEIQEQLDNMHDSDDNYKLVAPGTQSIEFKTKMKVHKTFIHIIMQTMI